jgi:hypothetical protein
VLGLGAAAGPAGAADQVTVHVMGLPQSYFVPVHGDTAYNEPYFVALASGAPDESDLRNVTASFDLSSLRGAVDVTTRQNGCTQQDMVVTCALGDFYQRTELTPLVLTATEGTPVGAAGAIELTVTADNAPTVTRSTQVLVGRPKFTTAPSGSTQMTSAAASVTPEFGNRGDIAVSQGITLLVTSQAPMTATYANCRYDKADRPTQAECDFDRTLAPGEAFRTDGGFPVDGSGAPFGFDVSYRIWPTGNPPEYGSLSAAAPHGTGGTLGLTAVDGSSLVGSGSSTQHFVPAGGIHVDFAATGFTIKGKVGDTVRVQVPLPTTDHGNRGLEYARTPQRVTVPAGMHVIPADDQQEAAPCGPVTRTTADCPYGPEPFGTILYLVIDKKVPGATGTITVRPDAGVDLNPANNTAVITADVTGGPATSGGAGSTAGSGSGGSSGASGSGGTAGGGGSGGSGPGGGTSSGASAGASGGGSGNLAATGTGGLALITGASALVLAGGTVMVAVRRRKTRTT